MKVRFGRNVRDGEAVDLRNEPIDAPTAVDAVETPGGRIASPAPRPAWRTVCPVVPDVSIDLLGALAIAARSRGERAPKEDEIERLRRRAAAIEVPTVDLGRARERVADAEAREATLRERVARLGGRAAERREQDDDAGDVGDQLRAAARELSEVETERIAAEQALSRARERAAEARDARARRLQLRDRADNLARDARAELAGRVAAEFAAAVDEVPGDGDVNIDDRTPTFRGPDATAALALLRVADLTAPAVIGLDRFGTADAARRAIDAPTVLV